MAGLAASFGSGSMTNSFGEIPYAEVLFLLGANPTEAHPIIGLQMRAALRRGAKFIVADPRKTWLAERAHYYLQLRPGTDCTLLNAIMNVIISEGLENKEFIRTRTEGFEALKEYCKDITPEKAERITGVPAQDIKEVARLYAQADKGAIFYTLGITEHVCGTETVRTIANLAMLTGHIGRPSTGVNPLRGQNNVQGASDMGTMPDKFHAYQLVSDNAAREKFERAWGVKLPAVKGLMSPEMFDAANEGKLKAMLIMGEDPVMSQPNQEHIINGLKKLEFAVAIDIFLNETAKYAHVILPAASAAEKDGTFTNSERRVQRVRKAVEPIGNSRADWQILCELSTRMGYPMKYNHPSEIWDELAALAPKFFGGISYDRIEKVGIQWPCPTRDHPGTQYLHKDTFTRGLGLFYAPPCRPPAEKTDSEFPLILSTGRTLFQYNAGTMSRRSIGCTQMESECFVEISPFDATMYGIKDGDMVKVISRRGEVVARAHVRDIKEGVIWMPMHYAEAAANRLTIGAYDNITMTPEYKVCAARVERVEQSKPAEVSAKEAPRG